MKGNNLTSFLLVSLIGLISAKVSDWGGHNKINGNGIGNDFEYNNEWDTCAMKAFPAKPETMCCGVDVTSSNRIVGGEPTALNQYPWMAIIEYQYINRKVRSLRCGGSLISGRYVLTAAHCVAGKILEQSIPVTVVLGDYDKFHNGPDCIVSNGKKICTEGELRLPIKRIKVHPGYDTATNYNDIALIQMTKMAPYTDAIRPICLPSGDLTKHFQENLWLDIAGWGTMKQEKVGNEYKSNTSAVKRHLHVPFVPTKECQKKWPQVNSKQMCAGGLDGKDACMGDSGGPIMVNNRGQYEVSGVVSYGHAKPCGLKGVPTVFTNVHEYNSWIINQIDIMERIDNNIKSTRFTPKYIPRTVDLLSKGNGLEISYKTTAQSQRSSTIGNIEETTTTARQRHFPNWNIFKRSEETTTPRQHTTPKENLLKRFQDSRTPSYTNQRVFRTYSYKPIHLSTVHPQMWVHNLYPSKDNQFGSVWQKTF